MSKFTISQAAKLLAARGIELSNATYSPNFEATLYVVSNDDGMATVSAQDIMAFLAGESARLF